MSRQSPKFWTGGIILGCAAVARLSGGVPDTVTGAAEAHPAPASIAPDVAPRFIMNPFWQTSNPEQKLLKDWLDIHQRMSSPVKYSNGNSPLLRDPRAKGC
jgi:hypothetical protein